MLAKSKGEKSENVLIQTWPGAVKYRANLIGERRSVGGRAESENSGKWKVSESCEGQSGDC